MAKIEIQASPVGPEPQNIPEAESLALEQELQLWAELLLDIYIDKRRRNPAKNRASDDFDSAAH
jgi:hypothetical protein